eukprot:gene1123-2183_t
MSYNSLCFVAIFVACTISSISSDALKFRSNQFKALNSSCIQRWKGTLRKEAITTFIIPSTGRDSLKLTLESLMSQVDPDWLAIVIIDGVVKNKIYIGMFNVPIFFNLPRSMLTDHRICFDVMPSTGTEHNNCAGQIRNYAMKAVKTPWVSFVDDDDTLDHRYVRQLRYEVKNTKPALDCIIFRMYDRQNIIPSVDRTDFILYGVGISFSLRHELYSKYGLQFNRSTVEDFILLDTIRRRKFNILLSPDVMYYVHNLRIKNPINVGERSIIKYDAAVHEDTDNVEDLQITCESSHLHQATSPPKFIFTETNSIFFANNVYGLNNSINRAIRSQCMRNWRHGPMNIHIMFDVNVVPQTAHYIQMNMEQGGTNHFTTQYFKKLNASIQIWDFSISNTHFYRDITSRPVYFIPSMLTLPLKRKVYTCSKQHSMTAAALETDNSWSVYENGCMASCSAAAKNVEVEVAMNSISNAECADPHPPCEWRPDAVAVCHTSYHAPIDVLFFGKVDCSYNRARESLCEELNSLPNVRTVCLQNAFGTILEYFVCRAKIIVIPHFYKTSSLETHRINPLLQAGRVVVIVSSADALLDTLYAPAVITAHPDHVARTVQNVLDNYQVYHSVIKQLAPITVRKLGNAIDPLCYALYNLQYEVSQFNAKNVTIIKK